MTQSLVSNQEVQFLRRVSRIVSRGERLDTVLDSLEPVFADAGARLIALEHRGARRGMPSIGEPEFDEAFPHRQAAALRDGGRPVGELVLGFRDAHCEWHERMAQFAGQQLGMLVVRLRLREKNAAAKGALEDMKGDIAARKFVPRAIALLVKQYRMRRRDAEAWLREQSESTGLSETEVAERLTSTQANAPGLIAPAHRTTRLARHRVA